MTPTPQALLGANIMFDFRPLYGDLDARRRAARLAVRLHAGEVRCSCASWCRTRSTSSRRSGLIRTFSVDDDPKVKGTIDLKTRGARLFVDCARVFALAHGIADTGTAARLRLAGTRLDVAKRHVDATVEAFHFLQLLRLAPAGPGATGPGSQPDRSVRAQRDRPANAEGGVPAGEAAAGAAEARLSPVARRPDETVDRKGQRLVALFLLGVLLFNYPLLALFDRAATAFGVPLLYVYIFCAWAALIALLALVIERSR